MKSVEHEDRLQRELAQKQQEVSAREYAQLDKQTRTQHSPFIDMRDAYAQVRDKNYQPTQQEIEYRRFTSGGFLDNEKGK
jgi:hypothetical protein